MGEYLAQAPLFIKTHEPLWKAQWGLLSGRKTPGGEEGIEVGAAQRGQWEGGVHAAGIEPEGKQPQAG